MIELDKNMQKCVRLLMKYRFGGWFRRHTSRQLLILKLFARWEEFDDVVNRQCWNERTEEAIERLRMEAFGDGPRDRRRIELDEVGKSALGLGLMALAVLSKDGCCNIDELLEKKIKNFIQYGNQRYF